MAKTFITSDYDSWLYDNYPNKSNKELASLLTSMIGKENREQLERLYHMRPLITQKTLRQTLDRQIAWQRQGFYAFGNGVFFKNNWYRTDDYGIVRLPDNGNFYLPSSSSIYREDTRLYDYEKRFVHLDLSTITLQEFTGQFFLVFGDNGKMGFSFLLATLFRDTVTASTSQGFFPVLSLFGPKGSGKTDMGKTLMRFFVTNDKTPNVRNSTVPALNETVAAVANGLVLLDEYKNDLDSVKVEFLKGLWDGSGRQRMNMDLDKRKEVTAVDSGVIIA